MIRPGFLVIGKKAAADKFVLPDEQSIKHCRLLVRPKLTNAFRQLPMKLISPTFNFVADESRKNLNFVDLCRSDCDYTLIRQESSVVE